MAPKIRAAAAPCPLDRAGDLDALPAAEVYRLFEIVMSVADRLPAPLPAARQHALSGHVFLEAPLLIEQVGRALSGRAESFDDVDADPEALRRRQERALAWECLQGALREVALRAGSLYIEDQAGAVLGAMAVVEQVRADAARPFPHPRAGERRRALSQAERVLADRQARKLRRPRAEAAAAPAHRQKAAQDGDAEAPARRGRPRALPDEAEAQRARARAWLLRR